MGEGVRALTHPFAIIKYNLYICYLHPWDFCKNTHLVPLMLFYDSAMSILVRATFGAAELVHVEPFNVGKLEDMIELSFILVTIIKLTLCPAARHPANPQGMGAVRTCRTKSNVVRRIASG